MLDVSDKFAGVPFTMIEKDSGEKVGLKGFTQSEFETALGLSSGAPAETLTATPDAAAPMPAAEPAMPAADDMAMPANDETSAPSDTTSSMPDATPNMPSMPGIDEAPDMSVAPAAAPIGTASAPVMPTMPDMSAMSTAATAPAPVAAPVEAVATTASPVTPNMAPANPQSQLDGVLSDLESKSQPDLPDFSAPSAGSVQPQQQ
ncbi:MAG: hypothetical protein UZ22_OP11002000399 [Microgenomates bacterium OLB23]|nr:MAG: hypothetical protein UZ22_OP11002000399 [Microgenomates bacterium OLB23]